MEEPNGEQIPKNYHQIPSRIEGIDVYAPKPDQPATIKSKSYKCPDCEANTHFDVAVANVACEHCGYKAPSSTETVGVSAAQHEFTLKALSAAKKGGGIDQEHMQCESCGAEFSISENSITAFALFVMRTKCISTPLLTIFCNQNFSFLSRMI